MLTDDLVPTAYHFIRASNLIPPLEYFTFHFTFYLNQMQKRLLESSHPSNCSHLPAPCLIVATLFCRWCCVTNVVVWWRVWWVVVSVGSVLCYVDIVHRELEIKQFAHIISSTSYVPPTEINLYQILQIISLPPFNHKQNKFVTEEQDQKITRCDLSTTHWHWNTGHTRVRATFVLTFWRPAE